MKITVLGPSYPYRGGIALFNDRLTEELIAAGHEVEEWTFRLQYPRFLFPGKTQFSEDPAPEGIVTMRKMNSVNPFNWIKVGRELKKTKPDLVIVAFWMPFMAPCLGTVARIARHNGHTRITGLVHNMLPHEHHPGDRLLVRYFANSVDGFTVMSDSVLHDVEMFNRTALKVFCRHPLYDNFGKPADRLESISFLGLDPKFRYVLFFGLIRDYKGLDLLMKAFADKRLRRFNVKLLVAGEFYSNESGYRELEKELGLEGLIEWKSEFVPNSEVRFCFGAADIIVQPYKSATQSGVAQIAYHFEKPMIVTNVGGLAEIVPDGVSGYVVEPDANQIADRLTKFFEEGKTDLFTEGLRREKRKYSWSNMARSVIKASWPD
ncbi:MAG: glycosyltransferase [Bacteroidaceae bacterium]|nr:glycosyltransferase [Bacteroidaceae bacterium]